MAITLTPAAADRVRHFLAASGDGLGLRFGVKRTGCSGWGYVTELAVDRRADDAVFEDQGVNIFVDATSLPRVDGTRIDFVREGLNHVFSFHNPRAQAECGCGESFTTDDQAA